MSGASHREVAVSVVAAVDVEGARLQLGPCSGAQRWVPLGSAAGTALRVRIAAQQLVWRRRGSPWDPQWAPSAMAKPAREYPANSVAPSVSANLSLALQRAGICRVGVRPRSVREYAANRIYALTGRVEDVAGVLGLSSLDTAARYIDSR